GRRPAVDGKAPAGAGNGAGFQGSPARFVVYAGRLCTAVGGTVADGAVLVEDGKVRFAGPRAQLPAVPEDTPSLAAAFVTPGLIDAHPGGGLTGALNSPAHQDPAEASAPNAPH